MDVAGRRCCTWLVVHAPTRLSLVEGALSSPLSLAQHPYRRLRLCLHFRARTLQHTRTTSRTPACILKARGLTSMQNDLSGTHASLAPFHSSSTRPPRNAFIRRSTLRDPMPSHSNGPTQACRNQNCTQSTRAHACPQRNAAQMTKTPTRPPASVPYWQRSTLGTLKCV